MGQGRIHEVGLARNLELLLPLHAVQRPHVVQPVGNLDEDDPDVVAQREQHLPEVLRLGALCGVENPEILVNPSMMARSRLPNIRSMSSSVTHVSSTVSWSSAQTMLVVSSPISSRKSAPPPQGWKMYASPTGGAYPCALPLPTPKPCESAYGPPCLCSAQQHAANADIHAQGHVSLSHSSGWSSFPEGRNGRTCDHV